MTSETKSITGGNEMTKKKATRRPVLITTEFRGVFFGYIDPKDDQPTNEDNIIIRDARCAIYFATTGGFLELASKGPNSGSRIGAKAPGTSEFRKVTSITDVSPEAVESWEAK